MRLNEIQTRFRDLILEQKNDAEFESVLAGKNLTPRLNVYRNNMMSSVSGALVANFPLLEKLVGKDFLNAMCKRYVLQNPPRDGYLTPYGSDFGDFVETYEAAKEHPYLADMARLESFINLSAHAKDDLALSADDLSKIPEQELENFFLKLRDSVYFLKSGWPLLAIRDMCLDAHLPAPDLKAGGVTIMVSRPALAVEITPLKDDEYSFLSALRTKTLGAALEDTLGVYPDFEFQSALQRHITLQTFIKPE